MNIEIKIGTELFIQDKKCIVTESRKCSDCAIQKLTSSRFSSDKNSLKCGTRYNGNTSDFLCSKETRSDKKNIIFKEI